MSEKNTNSLSPRRQYSDEALSKMIDKFSIADIIFGKSGFRISLKVLVPNLVNKYGVNAKKFEEDEVFQQLERLNPQAIKATRNLRGYAYEASLIYWEKIQKVPNAQILNRPHLCTADTARKMVMYQNPELILEDSAKAVWRTIRFLTIMNLLTINSKELKKLKARVRALKVQDAFLQDTEEILSIQEKFNINGPQYPDLKELANVCGVRIRMVIRNDIPPADTSKYDEDSLAVEFYIDILERRSNGRKYITSENLAKANKAEVIWDQSYDSMLLHNTEKYKEVAKVLANRCFYYSGIHAYIGSRGRIVLVRVKPETLEDFIEKVQGQAALAGYGSGFMVSHDNPESGEIFRVLILEPNMDEKGIRLYPRHS